MYLDDSGYLVNLVFGKYQSLTLLSQLETFLSGQQAGYPQNLTKQWKLQHVLSGFPGSNWTSTAK